MRPRRKTEVTTVKLTPEVRDLWERCALTEHRTLTSALEVMVREHAKRLGLTPNPHAQPKRQAEVRS